MEVRLHARACDLHPLQVLGGLDDRERGIADDGVGIGDRFEQIGVAGAPVRDMLDGDVRRTAVAEGGHHLGRLADNHHLSLLGRGGKQCGGEKKKEKCSHGLSGLGRSQVSTPGAFPEGVLADRSPRSDADEPHPALDFS